jgi:hypothetical protein
VKIKDAIEGMTIIAKYSPDQFCMQAEHDQMYCGSYDLPLTTDEKTRMEELGWFGAEDSWSFFT